MYQTLFYIPNEIGGMPVFGLGILLVAWLVFSVGLLLYLFRKQGPSGDTWGYVPVLAVVAAVIGLVLPRICKPQGLPIQGYGTMLLLAIVSGLLLVIYRAKRRGIHPDIMLSLAFWMILPGIAGARVFYVIEYWREFQRETLGATIEAMINLAEGGIVVYGALIGGLIGMLIFLTRHKLPKLTLCDILAPGLVLGLAIGRIGCLLNGCCYGHVCDQPWAITFPSGSHVHQHQVRHGDVFLHGLKILGEAEGPPVVTAVEPGSAPEQLGIEPGHTIASIGGWRVTTVEDAVGALLAAHHDTSRLTVRTVESSGPLVWAIEEPMPRPVHPTQLYSSLNAFLLLLLLLAAERWLLRRDGQTFALLISLYPIGRFFLEMVRTDEQTQFGTGLTISQIVSIAMLVVAAGLWFYTSRQPPRETSARDAAP